MFRPPGALQSYSLSGPALRHSCQCYFLQTLVCGWAWQSWITAIGMRMAVLGMLLSACCQPSMQCTWQTSVGLTLAGCNKDLSLLPA